MMLWNSCSAGLSAPRRRRQRLEREPEDARRLPRVDRQRRCHRTSSVSWPSRKATLQLAALEHAAVLIAEDWQQQLRVELRVLGAHSMSKKADAGELGPFSSTSFQRALRPVPMPM